MPEPPRRRRSTPPPSSPSVLPTIALGIGVVVAGLGIGALLSAMQHRGPTSSTTTTVRNTAPVVTPVARPAHGAVAVATAVPHATDTPTPAPTPTPEATPTPRVTPTARPTAAPPTSTPNATATPAAPATPHASATVPLARTMSPRTMPPATPTPVVVTPHPATPRPTPEATPRAVPAGTGGVAQSTVRRYLGALIAGNENAAYAELGKTPGEPGASLPEEAFIDRGTRITSMRTASTDPNGATVEVELTSSRGSYFATYHVTNGPNGPFIDQHDYIKV
jgi:hypothetical protein